MRIKALVAATFVLFGSNAAFAAPDVVVMRRTLIPIASDYSWLPGEWSDCSNSCGAGTQTRAVQCLHNGKVGYPDAYCVRISEKPPTSQSCTSVAGCSFTWQKGDWSDVAGCGDVVQTRKISCLRGDGTTVGNDLCPTPAPATAQTVQDVRTCSYSWDPGDWGPWSSECQTGAVHTRAVTCLRSNGETVDDASCAAAGAKPAMSETSDRFGQCGYSWNAKAWSDWSSTCAPDASRTRAVVCVRSNGDEVSDTFCSGAGAKPSTSEVSAQYGSCGYSWRAADWGSVVPACGASTQSRTVQCIRSNGDIVDDASCEASSKPAGSMAATDYSTCTYSWNAAAFGPPSTTCGDATSLRAVNCVSSDGRTVGDSMCSGTKPDQSTSSHETSGCGFSWQTDPSWSAPVPACGATVQNRGVSCLRADGVTVADASCTAATKPASQQAATDYSTCTFGWATGSYGQWSSSCGDATQTRSVTCQSSDGRTVDDSSCSSSTKPVTSQTSYQTTGCGYSWVSGSFGTPIAACGATTQSRTVTCQRSDGIAVADGLCSSAGAKPSLTQPASDFSTCGFSWSVGTFGVPTSTCGSATQTRSVTCLRGDGTTVTDTSCSSAGAKPAATQSSYQTTGCGYSWTAGSWGASDSTCSAHATQTRAVSCVRSDGQAVDGSLCQASTQPAASQSVSDLSGCTNYYYSAGGWSDWSSHCSANATRTMPIGCFRNETNCQTSDQYFWGFHNPGVSNDCSKKIPDVNCSDPASSTQGYSPASGTQNAAVYDQCGYTWQSGAWSAAASACGASSQTRSVYCQRSDGTTVSDASCSSAGTRPATSQAATNYDSCTFAWTYGGWNTTSQTCGSTSQSRTVSCQRSDGTTVADGYCSAAKPAATQTYTDYSSCGYSWQASAYSAQTNQCGTANQTRSVYCQRADGATVADSYCSGAKPAATVAYTNYNACTYYGGPWWGNYRYSSTCSATSQRSDDRTCYRSDGTAMSTADPCIAAGVPVTETVTVANYSGCGYSWQASTYSVPAGCGPVTASRSVTCQRSDGSSVDGSSCVNAGQGAQPATTVATSSYDGCSYSWYQSGFSGQSNQCGTAYQTQTVYCRRSDGAQVDDSICGGGKPATSSAYTNYNSCSYAASYGAFSACSGGTQSQGMNLCMRSDGTSVAGDYCVAAGQPWTRSQNCTVTWSCTTFFVHSPAVNVQSVWGISCTRSTDNLNIQKSTTAAQAGKYYGWVATGADWQALWSQMGATAPTYAACGSPQNATTMSCQGY